MQKFDRERALQMAQMELKRLNKELDQDIDKIDAGLSRITVQSLLALLDWAYWDEIGNKD